MKLKLSRSKDVVSLALALIISSLIWQFGETRIQAMGEQAFSLLTGRPYNQIEKTDAQGIPYQLYREQGARYNPLFIARRAQELALETDPASEAEFRKLSDWLLAHSTLVDSSLVCYYDFDLPGLGLKAPWPSALAQAVILNVFRNRAVLERDALWVSRTRAILRSLQVNADLGLSSNLADDQIWWWEYPGTDSLFVLNGMISVLFELWDYSQFSADPRAASLFDQGYQAVLQKLPEFDFHGYSRYAAGREMAGRLYHQKHIAQLQRLNRIKPSPLLQKYARRWLFHDRLPFPWQLVFNPRPWRVLGFIITWLVIAVLTYLMLVRIKN